MDVIRELIEETKAEGWTWKNWMICFLQSIGGCITFGITMLVLAMYLGG